MKEIVQKCCQPTFFMNQIKAIMWRHFFLLFQEYERPETPELVIKTLGRSVQDCVKVHFFKANELGTVRTTFTLGFIVADFH